MNDMPNEDELEAAMIWAAEQRRSVGFTITPIYGGPGGRGGSDGGGVTVNIGEPMRPAPVEPTVMPAHGSTDRYEKTARPLPELIGRTITEAVFIDCGRSWFRVEIELDDGHRIETGGYYSEAHAEVLLNGERVWITER